MHGIWIRILVYILSLNHNSLVRISMHVDLAICIEFSSWTWRRDWCFCCYEVQTNIHSISQSLTPLPGPPLPLSMCVVHEASLRYRAGGGISIVTMSLRIWDNICCCCKWIKYYPKTLGWDDTSLFQLNQDSSSNSGLIIQ